MAAESSGDDLIAGAVSGFLRYGADTLDLLRLHQAGAATLVKIRSQIEKFGQEPGPGVTEKAELAQREIERGFPLLNGHAIVGLWGALESCVDAVCAGWLWKTGGSGARDAMERIKVPLADVYFLKEPDRAWRVLDWVKLSQGASQKHGAGQFEGVLQAIGVENHVREDVRDLLYYAKEVCNAIAHRAGRADERLARSCPWLSVAAGDELRIGADQIIALLSAMVIYRRDPLSSATRGRRQVRGTAGVSAVGRQRGGARRAIQSVLTPHLLI